jgi:queuine/archaeosine tRNA-ribosyltransferase
VLEANKKKKYCLRSQYGNFSYAELESRRLLGEKCVCPVCKGHTLKEIYSTGNHDLFIDKLQVHRMYLQMSETDEYRQILHESGSVLDYMRDKPMIQNQVNTIVRDLIGKTT